jgi:hypothetical protein
VGRRSTHRGPVDRLPLHAPLAVVLLVAGAGIVRVLTAHWREGAVLLGGALLIAAALRALLPPERAGLLAVRGRPVDLLVYGAFGVGMIVLAVTITRDPLGFV